MLTKLAKDILLDAPSANEASPMNLSSALSELARDGLIDGHYYSEKTPLMVHRTKFGWTVFEVLRRERGGDE